MYSIFVNYRRSDHSVSVAALAERLAHYFGDDEVFLDVGIPSGERYPQKIKERLHGCDVLIAVIHDGWVATFDKPRKRDWVHYEIATALERDITVIPVLMEDARLPAWDQLPRDIADITLLQVAKLRSREFRSDVAKIIQRIDHHVDLDDAIPPKPPVKAKPAKMGLKNAALAIALFLVTAIVFFDPRPLWQIFAVPAFVSAAMLALASSATAIMIWALRGVNARWERRAGTRTHREALSRNWILAALWAVFCAYFYSKAMAENGWQEWNWWFLVVTVLLAAAHLHRWWRTTTEGDTAWPPPVTPDHWVFRRAALRLHEQLTTDKEWRHPRSRKTQGQAVSIYLDLAQTRVDLAARAALPVTRWIRRGYCGLTTAYLGWFTSIILLDMSSAAVLVFGDPVTGSPFRVIAITVAGATAFAAAAVTTFFLLDRYRVTTWIDELTGWQEKLGPLIFRTDAHEELLT
jgi:hypothetical protein